MWVRIWPHLALLLAMVFWSTSYVALRIALSALDPFTVMAGRMGVATLLFLPLWGGLLRDLRRKGQWRWLLLMAFAEPCCYFLLETRALCLTTASQAGMIISLLPLITAVVAWRLLGERVSLRGWIGFALAVAGVVWLSLQSAVDETATAPVLGNFFEGLAMVCAALYTVLVEGDDMTEPIADETRSILDGHIVLSRKLAAANHYPAIDVQASVSRVMNAIVDKEHKKAAQALRKILAKYAEVELLVQIGEYKKGADAEADFALAHIQAVNAFLRQGLDEKSSFEETLAALKKVVQ